MLGGGGGGNPAMDWHPIQGGVAIFLVASRQRNRSFFRQSFTNLSSVLNHSGCPSEMMITWVTMAEAVKSVVEYGERFKLPLNRKAYGSATKFKTCGWKERTIHIHRVKLEGLIPGRGYGNVLCTRRHKILKSKLVRRAEFLSSPGER